GFRFLFLGVWVRVPPPALTPVGHDDVLTAGGDMYDESDDEHDEGDTCPYCGDGPLHVHEGYLQCPNCGSSID
ncbi:MAG: hypothetical protein ACO371_07065, partial [Ilumatobacteraceae bacterium]